MHCTLGCAARCMNAAFISGEHPAAARRTFAARAGAGRTRAWSRLRRTADPNEVEALDALAEAADADRAGRRRAVVRAASRPRCFGCFSARPRTDTLLLVSADAAPAALTLREDLRTRLASGLTFQMHLLSDDEKAKALARSCRSTRIRARAGGRAVSAAASPARSAFADAGARRTRSTLAAYPAADHARTIAGSAAAGRHCTSPVVTARTEPSATPLSSASSIGVAHTPRQLGEGQSRRFVTLYSFALPEMHSRSIA